MTTSYCTCEMCNMLLRMLLFFFLCSIEQCQFLSAEKTNQFLILFFVSHKWSKSLFRIYFFFMSTFLSNFNPIIRFKMATLAPFFERWETLSDFFASEYEGLRISFTEVKSFWECVRNSHLNLIPCSCAGHNHKGENLSCST